MTDLSYKDQQAIVKELNATPLSLHLESLLRAEQAEIQPDSLMVVNLLAWAAANHFPNKLVGEETSGAANLAERNDPEAVYDNLTDDRMLQATRLEDASRFLATRLTEALGYQ